MKKNILLLLLLFHSFIKSESWSHIGSEFSSFGSGIGKQASGLIKGFAASGGVVSSDYRYSCKVFNGLQESITVEVKKKKNIFGGRFNSGTGATLSIKPGENSGTHFDGIRLYFALEIEQCNYTEGHYTLGKKNDTTVYAYHTYQDSQGHNTAEKVGVSAVTNAFSAMIYNGLSTESTITFPFNKKNISVSVEPDTYSALRSTDSKLIRPFSMILNKKNIAVGAEGLGISISSGTGKNTIKKIHPMRYNYEIDSSGKAFESGLAPGNFKQPINGKVRDITPMEFILWNNDISGKNDSGMISLNRNNDNLWFVYSGEGLNSSGDVSSNPIGLVPYGKALSFFLIRPQISKKMSELFIVRLSTSDPDKAKPFLLSLLSTQLPLIKAETPKILSTNNWKKTLLREKLPDQIGFINAHGVTGTIIGSYKFSPYSISSQNKYYLNAPPVLYDISTVVSTFMGFLKNNKTVNEKNIYTMVKKWIDDYPSNPLSVKQQVETFLIQEGPKSYSKKDGDNLSLTHQGLVTLSIVMYGPSSISKTSMQYKAITNTPSLLPSSWVKSSDVIAY